MDGEKNGKPYVQMDDLGGFHPPFSETPIWSFLFPWVKLVNFAVRQVQGDSPVPPGAFWLEKGDATLFITL